MAARFTTTAPPAVSVRDSGSGATGSPNFENACQAAAAAGTRMMNAIALPTRARAVIDHPRAMKISRLTAVSSRKSTLSAIRETDPMARATPDSTKK